MAAENPISRLRTALDLSQVIFAESLGVSQSTVSGWENGAGMSPPLAMQILKLWPKACRKAKVTTLELVFLGWDTDEPELEGVS